MNQGGSSLVISDKLSHSIEKSDLFDRLGNDITLSTWEYFIQHSADFDVMVLDMDLYNYTSEVGRTNSELRITEHKQEFFEFLYRLNTDISYFLESGDTVIVLLDISVPVVQSNLNSQDERLYNDQWLKALSLFENWNFEKNSPSKVTSNSEYVQKYFHAVSSHYELEINHNVVRQPENLALSSDGVTPAAVAVNEFIDDTGERVESEGTLIILPQPKSITKPHRIVEQLVGLGWEYHSEKRPEPQSREKETGSMQLSTSIEAFDNELVEHCFSKYARGEYADAATKALKILDNRLKETIGDEIDCSSTADLMKKAFRPSEGPLRMGEKPGEEEGVMFLYAGAIQGIRNPLSHRVVDPEKERYLDDFNQQKAHDIISYVNLLLSLLDSPEK